METFKTMVSYEKELLNFKSELANLSNEVKKQGSAIEKKAWNGPKLTKSKGAIQGPTGKETYYNLPMKKVVDSLRVTNGITDKYRIRNDGVKMIGPYVMVAANLKTFPKGTIVKTSLWEGIVCDTGSMKGTHIDIATDW